MTLSQNLESAMVSTSGLSARRGPLAADWRRGPGRLGLGRLGLLALVGVLLAACGPREIRDLPPLVRLSQIELNAQRTVVQIRIENPNDIPFHANTIRFALELESFDALAFDGATDVDIVPHSAEEIMFQLPLPAAVVERLHSLQARESVNWALEGVLPQVGAREWPFRARGVLYPVPGVSGVFRASAIGSAYPIRRPR